MMHVLIIDSAPDTRKHIIDNIKTLHELTVIEAGSLEEGVQKIPQVQPLIVLYDLDMHCSNLVDFINETRYETKNCCPVFVALYNKADDIKIAQALEGGTSYIIKKDVSQRAFQKALSHILNDNDHHLKLSEQQLHCRSLSDLSPNPVFLAQKDSLQIVDANRAAASVYGYSRDELFNMSLCELADDPVHATESAGMQTVFETPVFHRKKDGRLFPANTTYRYISKNSSDLVIMSVTDMSLSEKRTAEQQALALMERRSQKNPGYQHFMAMLRGEKNERRRISQEIHDHSAQHLVSAKLKTETLMKQFAGHAVYSELIHLRDDLVAAIRSLRSLTGNLNNDLLPYSTLASSIEELAKKLGSKIRLTCMVDGVESELNSHEKLHVYRIAEEALHNVLKHSPGRSAELLLQQKQDKSIALRIFSHGMNCRDNILNNGMGLRTMQQRGELIGGKVHIKASVTGFSVELRLPANRRKKTFKLHKENVVA